MKKWVLLCLFVLLVWAPAWSQTNVSTRTLQRKLKQRLSQLHPGPQNPYMAYDPYYAADSDDFDEKELFPPFEEQQEPADQLIQATAWAHLSRTLTRLNWQEFLKLNKQVQRDLQETHKSDREQIEQFLRENPSFKVPTPPFLNTVPDYSHAFTHKYVFIEEHVAHGSDSAPQEVINILTSARQTRPKAKILLAQEFLMWDGKEGEALLKKPNAPSGLYSSYPHVSQAAGMLNIDQLALDDFIFFTDDQTSTRKDPLLQNVGVKIGNYFVLVTPQDKLPPIPTQPGCSTVWNRWLVADQTIEASPFGILERNRQWARRLKAVEEDYDLIFVYAGAGHISGVALQSLPALLKLPDFALISLFPLGSDAVRHAPFYAHRKDALERANISNGPERPKQDATLQEPPSHTNRAAKLRETITGALVQWKNSLLPVWGTTTKEDYARANPSLKEPIFTKNRPHCNYVIFLKQARIPPALHPEIPSCIPPVTLAP